ncbi:hypothetical protein [Variovorax soli]|uniref:hypothetical protein n=1 Tax=Variovorax soli TaxID=376815 RepID=UPI000839ADB2|nr:hypothetical protein [Variovorax soli]
MTSQHYCKVCKTMHPSTEFYRYGGTGPSADRLRTYCKNAQNELSAAHRAKRIGRPYKPGRFLHVTKGTPMFSNLIK